MQPFQDSDVVCSRTTGSAASRRNPRLGNLTAAAVSFHAEPLQRLTGECFPYPKVLSTEEKLHGVGEALRGHDMFSCI